MLYIGRSLQTLRLNENTFLLVLFMGCFLNAIFRIIGSCTQYFRRRSPLNIFSKLNAQTWSPKRKPLTCNQ